MDKAAGAAPAGDAAGAGSDAAAAAPIGPAAAPQQMPLTEQQTTIDGPSGNPAAANGAEPTGEEAAAAEESSRGGLIGPQMEPQIGPPAGPVEPTQGSNGAEPQAPASDTAMPAAEHAAHDGKRDQPDAGVEAGITADQARPKKKPLLSFGDDDDDT